MKIKIATLGVWGDYRRSLVPLLIEAGGFQIEWVDIQYCDLLIIGPFLTSSPYRIFRRRLNLDELVESRVGRRSMPLRLFHTAENKRNNYIKSDYSISFDFSTSANSFRLPYWLEMIDWSDYGISGNENIRFGRLLTIKELTSPLGRSFMDRERRAVIFASHMSEPRKTLFNSLESIMPIDGMGPFFNNTISNHNTSGFFKMNVLKNYGFNLCPENSIYPGYYTEKIPEAFAAGCLPITWSDQNIIADFNIKSFINMANFAYENFATPLQWLMDESCLNAFSEEPLLLKVPDISLAVFFLKNLSLEAIT